MIGRNLAFRMGNWGVNQSDSRMEISIAQEKPQEKPLEMLQEKRREKPREMAIQV